MESLWTPLLRRLSVAVSPSLGLMNHTTLYEYVRTSGLGMGPSLGDLPCVPNVHNPVSSIMLITVLLMFIGECAIILYNPLYAVNFNARLARSLLCGLTANCVFLVMLCLSTLVGIPCSSLFTALASTFTWTLETAFVFVTREVMMSYHRFAVWDVHVVDLLCALVLLALVRLLIYVMSHYYCRYYGLGVVIKTSNNGDLEPQLKVTKEMAFTDSPKEYFESGKYPKGVGRLIIKLADGKADDFGLCFMVDLGKKSNSKVVLIMTDHQRAQTKDLGHFVQGPSGLFALDDVKVLAHGIADFDIVVLDVSSKMRSVTGIKALDLGVGIESFYATVYGFDTDRSLFWESTGPCKRHLKDGKKTMSYEHCSTTQNGSSGSPVIYKGHGCVLAVHRAGVRDGKEKPLYNLATSISFLARRSKLKGSLGAIVPETSAYHRDDYLDDEYLSKFFRLNPELDPAGNWDNDMFFPAYMEDAFAYMDDEDLYDPTAYGRSDVGIEATLGLKHYSIPPLIPPPLPPKPKNVKFYEPDATKVKPLTAVSEASPLGQVFEPSPAKAGVLDARKKEGAAKAALPSESLLKKVESKLNELEKTFGLDVSIERSLTPTKVLNQQLDSRLRQLRNFMNSQKSNQPGSRKAASDSKESGSLKHSVDEGVKKSKKNRRSSKSSGRERSPRARSAKPSLGTASQLEALTQSVLALGSKLVDKSLVAPPPPQSPKQ
jgi:hypothetical protein